MVELSVVVLCYHSGRSIPLLLENLKNLLEKHSVKYEIVLVANDFANSKDETINLVRQIAGQQPHVIAITMIKQGMMGWDMLQGMNACSGEYICVIDGDGQFPVESVVDVYTGIKEGGSEIVKTYRSKRHDGLYRLVISQTYNLIFNLLYPGLHSKDVNSKPKIFSKEVYSKLNLQSTDWFIDAEIMIKARKLHFSIKEIPITFYANESRKSFVKFGFIIEFIFHLIQFKFKKI